MSYTSLHQGYVRYNTAHVADGYPVSTAMARDCLVNNLLHLADSHAQVRVAYTSKSGSSLTGVSNAANDTKILVTSFGPFPINIRSDGTSYRLRVRCRGYATSYSGADVVAFYAVLSTRATAYEEVNAGGDNVAEFVIGSGTDAWLTATTSNTIFLESSHVDAAYASRPTPETVGGASSASVDMTMVTLSIFSESEAAATSVPNLTGVYAAEFIG